MRVQIISLLSALWIAPQVFGSVITYPDRPSWLAAVNGVVTQNFEGIAPAGGSAGEDPSVTLAGITYASGAANVDIYVTSSTFAPPFYDRGTGDTFNWQHGNPIDSIVVTLPANISGFAADLSDVFSGGSSSVTVSLSTGDVFVVTTNDTSVSFFGVTSTAAIASVTLSMPAHGDGMVDNVSTGTAAAAAAPEPASVFLFCLGLAGLALRAKTTRPYGGNKFRSQRRPD